MPIAPLDCSAVLTHHWLVRIRGGEKVLLAFRDLLPKAPIYTLVYDRTACGAALGDADVHTSSLQRIPGAKRFHQLLFALMPDAARMMRLPPADLVLCSDAAVAKVMRFHEGSKVVCYCHSPMRYVYEPHIAAEYAKRVPYLLRPLWRECCARARAADEHAASFVTRFIANSRTVADRIKRYYERDAIVIYPPVDVPATPSRALREDFYVCIGHHTPYKRLDLAVDACIRSDRKLVVIGDGPDVKRLAQLYRDNADARRLIDFRGWQPDNVVHDVLSRARGLIFPGEEDFGIVPVEAMAYGCPVIAYGVGGASESVIHRETGVLFDRQDADVLAAAIRECDSLQFDVDRLYARAWEFRRERFLVEIRDELERVLNMK